MNGEERTEGDIGEGTNKDRGIDRGERMLERGQGKDGGEG